MKPPSRHRRAPSRFSTSKKSESKKVLNTRWHRKDLENLLYALKQQNVHSELDILDLRKKVPKLSLLEIQNMIKSLKRHVGKRMYMQIQKRRREEQMTKVPIEIWAELAHRMTGVHIETISSAFSQMLVIAATEPISILHSVPQCSTDTPNLIANSMKAIHVRPMSHPGSEVPSTSPRVIILPRETLKTPVQSHKKNKASSPSAQADAITSPFVQSSLISNAKETSIESQSCMTSKDTAKPSTPGTSKSIPSPQPTSSQSQTVSELTSPASIASAASTAKVSLSSESDQLPKLLESRPVKQDSQYTIMWAGLTVDFEKIYMFMSNINNKNCKPALTPMESAVLLDLLMSLPEELPLLDCKELQHHMLEIYRHLNAPPKTPIPVIPSSDSTEISDHLTVRNDQQDTGVPLQTHSNQTTMENSGQTVTAHASTTDYRTPGSMPNDKSDWAAAGLSPLNPFMVPVTLLKQQES